MSSWTPEQLSAFADSDDLHISPFRADGTTYGTPTWIWSVVAGDALYVRAYNGTASRWYNSAVTQKAGRVAVAGTQFEVAFEAADEGVNDAVDAAYEAKYAGSPYLPPMITPATRAATVKVSPRP